MPMIEQIRAHRKLNGEKRVIAHPARAKQGELGASTASTFDSSWQSQVKLGYHERWQDLDSVPTSEDREICMSQKYACLVLGGTFIDACLPGNGFCLSRKVCPGGGRLSCTG